MSQTEVRSGDVVIPTTAKTVWQDAMRLVRMTGHAVMVAYPDGYAVTIDVWGRITPLSTISSAR